MEWSWLLSPNVIKPIQPTKTQAHTALLPSLWHTHIHAGHTPLSVPPPWFTSLVMMCLPCPWLRTYGTVTEFCSLLWYQWSAILQTSSKGTCQWSSYPAQPRTAASHDPKLSWVRLTYREPRDDLLEQLKVFDQFVCYDWAMNMIISGHGKGYLCRSLSFLGLWSTLALHNDHGSLWMYVCGDERWSLKGRAKNRMWLHVWERKYRDQVWDN